MNKEINKFTTKTKRRLIIVSIIVIAVLSICILLVSLQIMYKHNLQREQIKAHEFLVQIIESVKNQTDLYKKKAYERDIREIEIYKDTFSNNYEIELIDHDPKYYKYRIIFDQKYNFYAVVTASKDGFTLSHFKPQNEFY